MEGSCCQQCEAIHLASWKLMKIKHISLVFLLPSIFNCGLFYRTNITNTLFKWSTYTCYKLMLGMFCKSITISKVKLDTVSVWTPRFISTLISYERLFMYITYEKRLSQCCRCYCILSLLCFMPTFRRCIVLRWQTIYYLWL